MDVPCTNKNNRLNGREMFRQTTNKPSNTRQATEQTFGQKCRQTFASQVTKSSLSSNGNNVD